MSDCDWQSSTVRTRLILGILGLLLVLAIGHVAMRLRQSVLAEFDQTAQGRRQDIMARQVAELREGRIDCLVNPDPLFLDELLSDPRCRENLTTLYMGGDASDPRLARLRDLPNVRSIILFWTEHSEAFLESLRGKESIEALCFERSPLSRKAIEHLAALPNLKSLSLRADDIPNDLESLRDHPSLESLVLLAVRSTEGLIPILQSLPRLRHVTVEPWDLDGDARKRFGEELNKALPECECVVWCEYD